MPLNTIVVNQGDFQTNVPEGNSVQEIILPSPTRTKTNKLSLSSRPRPWTETLLVGGVVEEEEDESSSLLLSCRPSSPGSSPGGALIISTPTSTQCAEDKDNSRANLGLSPPTQVPSPSSSAAAAAQVIMTTMNTPSSGPVMTTMNESDDGSQGCDLGGFTVASNKGWGLSAGSGLRGGGLNSLNNGTSGWGAPPTNPNAASGWGTPPGPGAPGNNPAQGGPHTGNPVGLQGGGGGAPCSSSSSSSPPGNLLTGNNNHQQGGSNQWASNSPNRNNNPSQNGQQNISGSQINNNPNGNASGGGGPSQLPMPPVGSGSSSSAAMQLNNQNNMNPNSQQGGIIPIGGGGNPSVGIPSSGSSWAQAAGKSLQASGGGGGGVGVVGGGGGSLLGGGSGCTSNSNPNQPGNSSIGSNSSSSSSSGGGGVAAQTSGAPAAAGGASSVTSKQIEQLNSMREALFSHDGWGGNVNQDSTWDIPGSPEPTHKDLGGGQMSAPAGTNVWKVNVNNGTDLWEANLRNGGAPTVAPVVQKAPWGHTPSNNIGGTWGEEDDGSGESASVWSGPSGGPGQGPVNNNSSGGSGGSGGGGAGASGWMNNGPQQQVGPGPGRGGGDGNGMWNSAPMKKEQSEWDRSGGGGGGRPIDSRGHLGGGGLGGVGPDSRNVVGGIGGGGVGMVSGHENSHNAVRGGWDNDVRGGGGGGGRSNLDGGNPGMWNKPQVQVQQQQQPPLQQQGGGWGGPGGHSGLGGMGGGGMKPDKGPGSSGWDDVSPTTQRRPVPNIPNYDDGTAVWGGGGGPQQQQQHPGVRGMPPGRGGMPNKMDDAPVGWGGANRSNGWSGPDGPGGDLGSFNGGRGGGGGWEDKSIGSWGEPPSMQQQQQQQGGNSQWGGKPKTPTNNPSGWGDDGGIVDTSNWGAPPKNSNSNSTSSSSTITSSRYCNGSPNNNNNSMSSNSSSSNGMGLKEAAYWAAQANSHGGGGGGGNSSIRGYNNSSSSSNNNNILKNLQDFGGYNKKEDMELALRASHMNLSDAIDSLDGGRGVVPVGPGGMEPPLWGGPSTGSGMPGRHGRLPGGGPPVVDHDFDLGVGGPMGMGGPPPQQRYGVPNPKGFSGSGGGNSLMNNVGNNPASLGGGGGGGSINPTLLQRILNQQQQQQGPNNPQAGRLQPNNGGGGSQGGGGVGGSGGGAFPPFNKSVTVLVQQIQMAVQAGYLSNQILAHPLPPQSLVLLNSLLQHIKSFQILTQAQQQMGNSNSPSALQLSVQITKTKQNIHNLHNQIAAQQAHHAKQQHHHGGGGPGGGNDFMKAGGGPPLISGGGDGRGGGGPGGGNLMDPLGSFGSDFLLNNKDGGGPPHQQQQQPQSRLSQWTKIPSMEKEEVGGGNQGGDFSRAPGPQSGNGGSGLKNNSSLILGPSDTWSTSVGSRSGGDGWPTDHGNSGSGGNDNDPMKGGGNVGDGWQTDLVPEFEPGKPWKGTQIMTSVENDPTLTPGSVVRSPLSLATVAAAEIFAKSSNSLQSSSLASDSLPLSLSSSSTWSYTPTSGGGGGSTSIANSLAKLNSTRDLWDYGGGSGNSGQQQQQPQQQQQGSRPPPGLPKKQGAPVPSVPSGGGNPLCWLLLRNLSPQTDGSTLRTLCMQHGPLQKFHLNLNHGIALVKYNGRDEAAKTFLFQAQHALNNCVLGNTTILAEMASENDVQGLLHSLNLAQQSNSGFSSASSTNRGGNGNGGGGDDNPWGLRDNSPLWSNNPWGSSGLDAPDRATPSSLNSLLPDGLLGGESA